MFGLRIIVPGTRGNEDAEEKSFHSLDLVYSYFPNFNTKVNFKVKNILGQEKEIEQENLTLWRQEEGTEFSLALATSFNFLPKEGDIIKPNYLLALYLIQGFFMTMKNI
ncbi:hypothetical protein P4S63_20435 [Pseudoalteromonas sp. B193]